MGNNFSASFNNVTQIVETRGGLLLDASSFANGSTHGPLSLTFNTVWVVDAEEEGTPIGPYQATSPETHYENLLGRWSGPEKGNDDTWTIMWAPEGSEGVNFTLVRWLDMSYGELDAFQHGFNQHLKERLDSPGAKLLGEDPILGEALDRIETTMGEL
ncbi:hypothetical protein EI94DRAFT_1741241 [Lactarius quietus]|nr:hypothetical protein EI94DRAFT_1741241 [Lactarius quietus]